MSTSLPIDGWTKASEPSVTVNGHPLTAAQSMALRVAVQCMLLDIAVEWSPGPIAEMYRDRLKEIQELMLR
jgi:hypothetical protein